MPQPPHREPGLPDGLPPDPTLPGDMPADDPQLEPDRPADNPDALDPTFPPPDPRSPDTIDLA